MKKILITMMLSIASFAMINAQEDFRFGFQVSPTFSWIESDALSISSGKSNLGLKLGMVGEYFFRENYSIAGGIGFSFNLGGEYIVKDAKGTEYWKDVEKGEGIDDVPVNGELRLKYNLNYIEIPIGLKMRTREFGYIKYFAEIPVLTLGIGSQSRGYYNVKGMDESEKLNIDDAVLGVAGSWGLGGGIEYSLSQSTALVGGIYYQSMFTDFTKDENADDSKGTMGVVVVRLGVLF